MSDICENNHGGNAHSAAAFASTNAARDRDRVWYAIRKTDGLTCDEAEQVLGMSHQSCSARITELKARGMLGIIGDRHTRSGRMAAVYVALTGEAHE